MRRIERSMLGVTLLEIMLVLAVAAMIIVMSVRYYQSANASNQANIVLQQIQAITASADGLAQSSGKYSAVTTSNITPLLSNVGGLTTPWGTAITITSGTTTYGVKVAGIPANVCGLIWGRLQADAHYASLSKCNATGNTDLTYTYTPNP